MNRAKKWAVLLAAMVLLAVPGQAEEQGAARRPKLIVVLVVDQMRTDYIEKFRHQWTSGLRRLLERGAWFRQAAYPYMNTITCAGHATIATGTFPATHGIILNAWWDRDSGKTVSCTEDAKATSIGYSAAVSGGHSPTRLMVPTLSDELRAQLGTTARVVTLSLKPRAAIMLAGHRAHSVTWFDAGRGTWVTSSAYASGPVAAIQKFILSHPVENDSGKSWTRALPGSAYLFADDAVGEKPPGGWAATFPHPLPNTKTNDGKLPALFYQLWQASPFADAYVSQMAQFLVDEFGLGKASGTDYLAVSFDALDSVGHAFGPSSHEVQDTLVRLDAAIGELLAHLDRAVGPENYVVAFSADHGVAPIPEQLARQGFDAGRIVTEEIAQRTQQALDTALGPGHKVARVLYTDLYFAPGVYDKLLATPPAMKAVRDAIFSVPGVWRVFRSDELDRARNSADPVERAATLSYYPGRSGDLVVVPRPYWFFVNASNENPPGPAATHGTAHYYDTRVPVILMGAGIRPGEYLRAATPADIAPTLALLCGITLARPDGRVLSEALVTSSPAPATAKRAPAP